MKRRIALKNVALVIAGAWILPACDFGKDETEETDQLLLSAVDTIIPATDTPGAKDLKVHDFVKTMVADCYSPQDREIFVKGLAALKKLSEETNGKAFYESTPIQRAEVLKKMENSKDGGQKKFYETLKGLTIMGYMNSEYVMTNITKFKMIPGPYKACIPVSTT
jgi:hypothetical protein